ncbi:OmpA family protein [Hippea alviniae]|uniref:OmpA family protein n=1 Tax=Hippea alviniae TaxID=1279027 RepID=UPI0003B34D80|nr:OmpA family protein [Hippea alviniae]
MKRFVLVVLILLTLSFYTKADELITGANKTFIPADKILFENNFSKCPVGEPPSNFDKVIGAGECVKYNNQIWLAPSTNSDFRVYKKLFLGRDEFSIEFDYLPYQKMDGAVGPKLIFRFLESRGSAWDKAKPPYDIQIAGYYNRCGFYLENIGKIGEIKNCFRKRVHVAIQVRRHQLRIYANGKRLISAPFNLTDNEQISGFEFMFVEDTNRYGELISNIKVGKYSKKEEKPSPEKVGISVEKTKEGTKLTIPEKVLFDFNKFFLKEKAKKALHVVAEFLKEQPNKKILIIGYTDNIGSDTYNLKLSLQRAQSVADYLIYVEGIDKNRIKIEGKGKSNPIAPNTTEEGRAKNRRVEIVILD